MAKDIEIQRKRLGGNFVVARAIGSKKERNHIRSMLPDCIFIILSMTKESQMKRLLLRHGEDESAKKVVKWLNDIHKHFEPPAMRSFLFRTLTVTVKHLTTYLYTGIGNILPLPLPNHLDTLRVERLCSIWV